MRPGGVTDFYPLAPLQEGLLFHSLASPGTGLYYNQCMLTLRGEVDAAALESAWQRVVAHHAVLRTFFVWEGLESPVQVVDEAAAMPFELRDLRRTPAAQQPCQIDERLEELRALGFELSRAPLMRFDVFRTGDRSYECAWSYHHLLLDGWSTFRVLEDVFRTYDALSRAEDVSLVDARPYRDFIAWIRSRGTDDAAAFWRDRLEGFTAPNTMPEDQAPRASGHSAGEDSGSMESRLDPVVTKALLRAARDLRVTPSAFVQLAWGLALRRYAPSDDVVFGAVVSGRPADLEDFESMVGLFINTLPVRLLLPPEAHVQEVVLALQRQNFELQDYGYCRLVDIQSWSEVPPTEALFQTAVMFENYKKDRPLEAMSEVLSIERVSWFERASYPLALLAIPEEGGLTLRILYDRQRFEDSAIERTLGHLETSLTSLSRDTDVRVAEVPLLTEAERREILVDVNDTGTDYPRRSCIHELFEEQVDSTPDAVAVSFGDQHLTYRELDERANQLAHYLRRSGVGPEVGVALALERTPLVVVAILAILKAGGFYVPLDRESPSERLAGMLEDAGAGIVVTEEKLSHDLSTGQATVVPLDTESAAIAREDSTRPRSGSFADNLAYVMFTSGSTGRPKGVAVTHRSVVRLVRGNDFIEFGPDEVFLLLAPTSFDASTLEIWGALLNGGRLVVYPVAVPSAAGLDAELRSSGVTTLWLTAGLFHELIAERERIFAGVRQLLVGGDVVSPDHARKVLAGNSEMTLINGYGPTENTTFSCCHPMYRADDIDHTVPIGRPIRNTTAYVLDGALEPVPIGAPGRLYVGGDGLARGYLQAAGLTAERFLPNPFSDEPGRRMYDTGDIVRRRSDGCLDFIGRDDRQVKLRGYRIEPGEIEAALREHSSVGEAIVLCRDDLTGGKQLVGYVVSAAGATATDPELKRFLCDRVPGYMVPLAIVVMARLPLTPNGKVDRARLPAPPTEMNSVDAAVPRTSREKAIAEIWADVLDLEAVGLDDSFFDLGGHSLLLIRAHERLQTLVGRSIPLLDMFEYSTVRGLAAHLESTADPGDFEKESGNALQRRQLGAERRRRLLRDRDRTAGRDE